jgi:hypothetical protein
MTPLLHHVLKDAREVRRLLVAWVGVLLAKSAIPFVPVDVRVDRASSMLVGGASSMAVIVGLAYDVLTTGFIAVTTVLVVQLVHSDSPTSAQAFWVTRPIPRRTMLAVKLAEIVFVLCLVPVVADAAVLALHRLPATNIAAAAAEGWGENLLIVLPLAALAALTLDAGSFALGGLGLIAAGTLTLAAVLTLLGHYMMPRTLEQSAMTAGFGAGAACAAIVTADLYLQRSRRRGLALAGAGVLVFALAVRFWQVDFVGDRRVQQEAVKVTPVIAGATGAAGGLRLEVVSVDCVAGACGVLLRETRVASLFDHGRRYDYSVADARPDSRVVTQEGLVFGQLDHFPGSNHLSVRYPHVRLTGMLGSRLIDADSLAAATLVRKAVTP